MNPEIPQWKKDLNNLKEAQNASAINSLANEQRQAISSLNAEEGRVKPAYKQAKTNASVQSQIGAKNLSEYLANRGMAKSGIAGQLELARNSNLQNQFTNIGLQEQSVLDDIGRRRTDVNENYTSGVRGAEINNEANYMKNVINQGNVEREWEQSQIAYKDALEQRDWKRAMEEQARMDMLKQQQISNSQRWAGIQNAKDRLNWEKEKANQTDYEVNNPFYQGTANPDLDYGHFANGQPNNIGKQAGGKVSYLNPTNETVVRYIPLTNGEKAKSNSTIYTDDNGNRYIWKDERNSYYKLPGKQLKESKLYDALSNFDPFIRGKDRDLSRTAPEKAISWAGNLLRNK